MSGKKIYTRTGDKGETSLFTGQRIPKDDEVIHAIGSVDECNCRVGFALSLLPKQPQMAAIKEQLETIQHALFDLGAALATPRTRAASSKVDKTRFDQEETELLEKWMDQMDAVLPPLHTFILPGGDPCGAALHLARSACRTAERYVVPLNRRADVSSHVMIYLNRLSDYFFMLSRYINHLVGSPETTWQQHKVTQSQ